MRVATGAIKKEVLGICVRSANSVSLCWGKKKRIKLTIWQLGFEETETDHKNS